MNRQARVFTAASIFGLFTSIAWAAEKNAASNPTSFTLTLILALIPFIAIYFAPSIVGFARKKDNKISIFMLNLFLGWCVIGWVVALVWAVAKDKATVQNIYVQPMPSATE